MNNLMKNHMPLSLHCDLGNNKKPFKYLPLMKEVLKLYPKNIIVWMHLGLSKELSNIDTKTHTQLLNELLKTHSKLYFDISWSILYEEKFYNEKERYYYVELLNKWPTRFLPGTDFVASKFKKSSDYKNALKKTSNILQYINDYAFSRIALGENYFYLMNLPYDPVPLC